MKTDFPLPYGQEGLVLSATQRLSKRHKNQLLRNFLHAPSHTEHGLGLEVN